MTHAELTVGALVRAAARAARARARRRAPTGSIASSSSPDVSSPGLALAGYVKRFPARAPAGVRRDGDHVPPLARPDDAPRAPRRQFFSLSDPLRLRHEGAGACPPTSSRTRRRPASRILRSRAQDERVLHAHQAVARGGVRADDDPPRLARRRVRRRAAVRRPERHRQVGVRARSRRARPSPRRRRSRDRARGAAATSSSAAATSCSATTWRFAASGSSTFRRSSASAPCGSRSASRSSCSSRSGITDAADRPHRARWRDDRRSSTSTLPKVTRPAQSGQEHHRHRRSDRDEPSAQVQRHRSGRAVQRAAR